MSETTRVIFRKDWDTGEVTAYFPDLPWDTQGRFITCYRHVGQHGGADLKYCLEEEGPASENEYASLKSELEGIGYVLEVSHV